MLPLILAGKAVGFLRQLWLPILAVAAVVGSGLIVKGVLDKNYAAKAKVQIELAVAQAVELERAAADARIALYEQVNAELADSRGRIEYVKEIVTREVPRYVTVSQAADSDCNLTVGAVRLLNCARTGSAECVAATGVTDAESRAPSVVTGQALIQSDAEVALRYNDLAVRHDALIDFLNRHVYEEGQQ